MSNLSISVYSLLIPVSSDAMLLPNASVAELIGYAQPTELQKGPDWCIGILSWRGVKVPLLSIEAVRGNPIAKADKNSRIAILNALGGDPRLPFFAVVTQGIPHLVQANQSIVSPLAGDSGTGNGVLRKILVEGEPAMIPDLDALEAMILGNAVICAELGI